MLNSFASAFEWFGTPDGALLVWGLFSRSVGFVFFVALASLALQTRGLYGRRGLTPLHGLLARYRAHYGVLPGMWYHPSLLWLVGTSDVALLTITVLGAACGVMAMVGGPWSPASLAFAWAVMLSYDSTVTGYPWDSVGYAASHPRGMRVSVFTPTNVSPPLLVLVSRCAAAAGDWVSRHLAASYILATAAVGGSIVSYRPAVESAFVCVSLAAGSRITWIRKDKVHRQRVA